MTRKLSLAFLYAFVFFLIWTQAFAGLKTANVVQVTSSSMQISITAPNATAAPGLSQLILVVKKQEHPTWYPRDGVDYTLEEAQAAAGQSGDDYLIIMENSSDSFQHSVTVDNLEMGTRYVFKPWFKYNDSGIKYMSAQAQYGSDEFYRHQGVLNTLASELAKLTYELEKRQEMTESSFTQTVLSNAADDATQMLKEGVTEGIKNYVMDKVIKKTGLGALSKFSDTNRAKIENYYNQAKSAYDQGKEYADVVNTIDESLKADNPALDLSRAAVTVVAPYAEPIFYMTELAVDSYVETAGIKAEIEVFTESCQRMQAHLDEEIENFLETVKSETYYGFCVTDLGGVLDHDISLIPADMPYRVSKDLVLAKQPVPEDIDGHVTLSIVNPEQFILVQLDPGCNIIVQENANMSVEGAIFDKVSDNPFGAIVYEAGSLGRFELADIYHGGENQPAQLIIRSSGEGGQGFELYAGMYGGTSAGLLVDSAKVISNVQLKASANKGPGVWLKDPAPGTLIKIIHSINNYQGLLFDGEQALKNADIKTSVGTRITDNQHPGTPLGSEDLVFQNMDHSDLITTFLSGLNMLRPIKGVLFSGKLTTSSRGQIRQFTIPPGQHLSVSDAAVSFLRYHDSIRVKGELALDGPVTVLADSVNTHGFIDVVDGGKLTASGTTFAGLDPQTGWDGVRLAHTCEFGELSDVSFIGGGAGTLGAQLTIQGPAVVKDSLFDESQGIGIWIDQPAGRLPEITGNIISNSQKHGLFAYNVPEGLQLRNNRFEASNGNNLNYLAVYAEHLQGTKLDAKQNFWDDDMGPTAVDNPSGLGSTAGALVDYDPWIGKSSDTIPDDTTGSQVFDTRWDHALATGGYYLRTARHSSNVQSIYPLVLTDPGLRPEEYTDSYIRTEEQLYTFYADSFRPDVRLSDDKKYLVTNTGEYSASAVEKPGHKIYFTRAAYWTVKNLDTNTYSYHYRIIDRGDYIPFLVPNQYSDFTLPRAGSPYVMKGYYYGRITVEPGTVILMPQRSDTPGIILTESAALDAEGTAFLSVTVPDQNQDGIISETDLEHYIKGLDSPSSISPDGDHVRIQAYRGSSIFLDDCLVINTRTAAGLYKTANTVPDCTNTGFVVTNSRLFNFGLTTAGGRVEFTNNDLVMELRDQPAPNTEKEFIFRAASYSETCPVIFKENRILNTTGNMENNKNHFSVSIRGGAGNVDISGNNMIGVKQLEIRLRKDGGVPAQRINISDNRMTHSMDGMKITSYSSSASDYYNIHRLKIQNNVIQIDPGLGIYCGTDCKTLLPGILFENFNADDIGMTLEASNNSAGMVAFGKSMNSGRLDVTSELALGLAGERRTFIFYIHGGFSDFFKINSSAHLSFTGTKEEWITLFALPTYAFEPRLSNLRVYGQFDAAFTRVVERLGEKAPCTPPDNSPLNNFVNYYQDAKGKLDNIIISNMNRGISTSSDDFALTNARLFDNKTAVELLNSSANLSGNHFARNCTAISLTVEDSSAETFTASPSISNNKLDMNTVGIDCNNLSVALNLAPGNFFIGDKEMTGIRLQNSTGTVGAQNVYWGDNSGPSHPDNAGGTGLKIDFQGGGVNFSPWRVIAETPTVTPGITAGKGQIVPSSAQTVDYGDTAQFSAAADQGYHVEEITGTCSGSYDDETHIFTTDPITKDCTINAAFAPDTMNVTADYKGRGTIQGNGFDCPTDCSETIAFDTQVTLSASPEQGWAFDKWEGCGQVRGTQCDFVVDSNISVTAVFKYGDVNKNTLLDLMDPLQVLKACVGLVQAGQDPVYLDFDNDEKQSSLEAVYLLQDLSNQRQ